MDKFSLNEIATVAGLIQKTERNGEECEIVGIDVVSSDGEAFDYAIRYKNIPDHEVGFWVIKKENLRKKKPPEEPATWQEIQELTNWNPTKEVAL